MYSSSPGLTIVLMRMSPIVKDPPIDCCFAVNSASVTQAGSIVLLQYSTWIDRDLYSGDMTFPLKSNGWLKGGHRPMLSWNLLYISETYELYEKC